MNLKAFFDAIRPDIYFKTSGNNFLAVGCGVYRVLAGADLTTRDSVYVTSGASPSAVDVNTVTDDAVFGAALGSGNNKAWTGLTEDDEVDINTNEWVSWASHRATTDETPRSIDVTNPSSCAAVSLT